MINKPTVKIGIVAVSRDCFPESLSVNRRKALVEAYTKKYGADDIYEWLRTYVENIHDNVEVALRDLYKTPNKSLFAAIKDLYDRITYTMVDNESKIAEEWRYLYEDWMALIWKDDYQKESALQSIAEEWNAVTGALSKLNSIEYFTIEN